jgi:hypothetical protein
MNLHVTLWVVSAGLALAFAAAGAMKLVLSKDQLVRRGAAWTANFGTGTVKFAGFTEIVAAAGMILPAVLDFPHVLARVAAAVGLIVATLGAAVIHGRLREPAMIVLNLALLALAWAAVWGRCCH